MLLQLIAREYDCRCGTVHRYHEGILFELHGDWRLGNDRWIYAEILDNIAIAIIPGHGIPQNTENAPETLGEYAIAIPITGGKEDEQSE